MHKLFILIFEQKRIVNNSRRKYSLKNNTQFTKVNCYIVNLIMIGGEYEL